MGGVDQVDQQLHNIQSLRKSYKWYKKLALQHWMRIRYTNCTPVMTT